MQLIVHISPEYQLKVRLTTGSEDNCSIDMN